MLVIKISGDAPGKLAAASGKLRDLTPAMRAIGAFELGATLKTFGSEGRPNKWPALAESTAAYKAKKKKTKMLMMSGMLRRSMTVKAGSRKVDIGSSLPYSAIHQFGGDAGRGHKSKIPARPYLVVLDEDIAVINKIMGDYVRGALA
ncbi:MAG: phage virion morphogenesis protein [Nitrospinae bacterium]|nr:phage virion morphogenesis protein [Nitrospinota bacterium]